ncbi:MAG: ABC transporter substrate-binding protein, partial [Candidatus Rokuibacteriota bacterium]
LVVTEVNRLYEVTRYVAITNHMWSGFNMLANGRFWSGLPADVQAIIERNVAIHVARQREYTQRLNRELESRLAQRGLVFNRADVASFRRRLGDAFYRRWKAELGTTAWRLLEAEVGPLI